MDVSTAQDDGSQANEILARSRRVYEECESYMDIGLHHGSIGIRDEAPFITYFQRPDRFRFEYLGSHPHEDHFSMRGVITRDEPGEASLWHMYDSEGKDAERLPVHLAIASLTGVSHGTAFHVPYQLLCLMTNRERWMYQLLGSAEFDGHRCFRIESKAGMHRIVWIDQESFLVRRTEKHTKYPSVAVYRPRLNPPQSAFPPAAFAFDPAHPLQTPLGDGEAIAQELRHLIGDLPKPERDVRFDDWPKDV